MTPASPNFCRLLAELVERVEQRQEAEALLRLVGELMSGSAATDPAQQ